jgi:uncharacterized protein (DUF4415 family)
MPKTDPDSPQWTASHTERSVRLQQLPKSLQTKLRRGRGPGRVPAKQRVSLRLAPEVLEAVQATGDGWQRRVEDLLRAAFVR